MLRYHKNGVRAVVRRPRLRAAATASADAIKASSLPRGAFDRNLGVESLGRPSNDGVLINALTAHEDLLLVSGGNSSGVTFGSGTRRWRFTQSRRWRSRVAWPSRRASLPPRLTWEARGC